MGAAVDGSSIEADANKERKGASQEIEKLWSRRQQGSVPLPSIWPSRLTQIRMHRPDRRRSHPNTCQRPTRRRRGP